MGGATPEASIAAAETSQDFEGLVTRVKITNSVNTQLVGARLMGYWNMWKFIGTTGFLLNVVKSGFKFALTSLPPRTRLVPPDRYYPPEKLALLDIEIKSMLAKRAIVQVSREEAVGHPGFFSHLFLVPKKDGSWRPIIDLSALNKFIQIPTFSMDSVKQIRLITRQGDWAASIDLSDAYFHIGIHPKRQCLLRFVFKGIIYQFLALPFGLAPAPWIFTLVMNRFREFLVSLGIRIYMYLDDWLILGSSKQLVESQLSLVLHWCQKLGLNSEPEEVGLSSDTNIPVSGCVFSIQ